MKLMLVVLVMALSLGLTGVVLAASSTPVTVTYEVSAINEVSVSSGTVSLTVNAATAGSEPTLVSSATSSYNITTNGTNKKITGALNTAMPTDVTLTVALAATDVGTSEGDVPMTDIAANLVTAITRKKGSSLTITYKLSALVTAGVVSSANKTLTLTISD